MGVAEVLCVFYLKKSLSEKRVRLVSSFERTRKTPILSVFFAKCKGGVGPIEPSANCGGIYVSNIGLCIQIDGYQIT